ncbi:DinB family protein [Micromonospora sp. C51]|uniref:DinB family protein n=1 Tax=Micromonospora sp. C51 TaxID=2824879 RepID=UPI001B36D108|nr:DinB family protein [Micromonospora sp. C51]MBQ1047377.1 DinB family protein [Micromonospora sp. C51]
MVGFPDVAADERSTLEQFLDFHRQCVLDTLDGLGRDDAATRLLPATDLTIGGIAKHLARVEDLWFQERLLGVPAPEPWASAPLDVDPDWDFHSARQDSPADLAALYAVACQRSRRAAACFVDLSDRAAKPSFGGGPVSLRWIFLHMIEETAQHRGHLDLLRDALARRARSSAAG